MRAGDTLVVWRLDRLGRSIKDLIEWTTGNPEPEPNPGDVFRQRLNTILEDAVGRLESLADEVLPKGHDEDDSKK